MNLLAHLHLGAHLPPASAAGNLTADFCRQDGSSLFREGVLIHRHIDRFTDTSPEVSQARRVFPQEIARFSSILIDLAFDYCLAKTWDDWSPHTARCTFIDDQLAAMTHVADALPDTSRRALQTIIEERWLHGYHEVSGIHAAIERIVKRKPRFAPMLQGTSIIDSEYDTLCSYFFAFYPKLAESVRQFEPCAIS